MTTARATARHCEQKAALMSAGGKGKLNGDLRLFPMSTRPGGCTRKQAGKPLCLFFLGWSWDVG